MNEPGDYELLSFALKTVAIGAGVYIVLRLILKKMVAQSERVLKKRLVLDEKYGAYSNDELLQLLKNIECQRVLDIIAILNAARVRMEDERIKIRIQQLQKSRNNIIKKNTNFIMKDYMEGKKSE